jgi:predicted RNase H-like HicB family nuclease
LTGAAQAAAAKESQTLKRALRCFAEGREGNWEAICLDLDIAVQGGSFEDVFRSLNEAIALYVETAEELPPRDRQRLLNRPAPLSVRLRFLWLALRSLFPGSTPESRYYHQFTLPAAA